MSAPATRPVTVAAGPAVGCIALFLTPFAAVGIFAAVQASRAAAERNWIQAVLLGVFALVFGGVGVGGLIAAAAGGRRLRDLAERQTRHPDEPWLWRADWADRRVTSGVRGDMWSAWIFAALWLLISLPSAFFGARAALTQGNAAGWIALLFPVIGLGLLARAVRLTLRTRRYPGSVLELATLPAPVGHTLEGRLRVPGELRPAEGFHVVLSCIRRTSSGTGKGRSTKETVLWQDERRVSGAGGSVPIAFAIPGDAVPSDPRWLGDRVFWRLDVDADVPGVDYTETFEVPVFRTAGSPDALSDHERQIAAESEVPDTYRQPPGSRIEVSRSRRGLEIELPAARNPGVAGGLTLITLIWLGVVLVLVRVRAPSVFPLVFGAFGVVLVYAALDLWLRVSRVAAGNGRLTVASGWGVAWREREIRGSDIRDITPSIGMQSGRTAYYDLALVTTDGKRYILGRALRDKHEAEWLAEQLRRALGPG